MEFLSRKFDHWPQQSCYSDVKDKFNMMQSEVPDQEIDCMFRNYAPILQRWIFMKNWSQLARQAATYLVFSHDDF